MNDTTKYLIHAEVTADGVVERSDVVGAIFGQTEGLLGDELDLRDLQQSSKVGRINVEIGSERGTSTGEVTIETSLDKVATATLAAALETITRVGPCRASCEVTGIEDVRAAKRREVVDRAKELLRDSFDDSVMTSEEILSEVRQHVRVEDITEYEGLPAGPNVADSDAIVVVEGRSDVLTLLRYGIKNAVAVEGTNVPDAVADLTQDRTVTAFLDSDRGGDLILRELDQVGDIDYVAVAPEGKSVEDLSHHEVFEALRGKTDYEQFGGTGPEATEVAATDGSATPAPGETTTGTADPESSEGPAAPATATGDDDGGAPPEAAAAVPDADDGAPEAGEATVEATDATDEGDTGSADATSDADAANDADATSDEPRTIREHVAAVAGTDLVRLIGAEGEVLEEGDAAEAVALRADADVAPTTVVTDGEAGQKLLDVAAQRGVEHLVAASLGEFTKRPTNVRLRTTERVLAKH